MCGSDRAGMISVPSMLLIGSGSRDSGKTTFACSILSHLADHRRPVAAVKATVIRETSTGCPRGHESCGVCGSLTGRYAITRETDPTGDKDTQRMLAAGADPVYWLRVKNSCVEPAMRELLSMLPRDRPIICESNTLRLDVEPGCFLQVRKKGADEIKSSARRVEAFVDRYVVSDGHRFDPAPSKAVFDPAIDAKSLSFPFDATAVILAGGKSSRMGSDKALLELDGKPLVSRLEEQCGRVFDEVIISTDTGNRYPFLESREIADADSGAGPIAGIAAGLNAAGNDRVFFVACDIPRIDRSLITSMLRLSGVALPGAEHPTSPDVVIPRYPDGRIEPLVSVLNRRIAPIAHNAIQAGIRRIRDLYARCRVEYIEIERPIPNLNTPQDFADFVG